MLVANLCVDVPALWQFRFFHVFLRAEVLFEHKFWTFSSELLVTDIAIECRFKLLSKGFLVLVRVQVLLPLVMHDLAVTHITFFVGLGEWNKYLPLLIGLSFFAILAALVRSETMVRATQ